MTLSPQMKTRVMFARHPRLAKEFMDKTKSMVKMPEKGMKKPPVAPKM